MQNTQVQENWYSNVGVTTFYSLYHELKREITLMQNTQNFKILPLTVPDRVLSIDHALDRTERTDRQTDWMDRPKPICPFNFFEVGGIITGGLLLQDIFTSRYLSLHKKMSVVELINNLASNTKPVALYEHHITLLHTK